MSGAGYNLRTCQAAERIANIIDKVERVSWKNKKTNAHPYGTYHYYRCITARKMKAGTACGNHNIRIDKLQLAVTVTIQKMVDVAIEMSELLERINKNPKRVKKSDHLSKSLDVLREERQKAVKIQLDLYPDWKNGLITQQEYLGLKANISEKIAVLDEKIRNMEESLKSFSQGITDQNDFISTFKKYGNFTELTRPMLVELVDEILVHENSRVEVRFKFRDAYAEVLEYIEVNKKTLSA